MGILSWIILGLIAGALAKWLMPGEDGGGIFITMGLGIAGAFTGGYVGSLLGAGETGGLSLISIVTATAGASVLLFIYRQQCIVMGMVTAPDAILHLDFLPCPGGPIRHHTTVPWLTIHPTWQLSRHCLCATSKHQTCVHRAPRIMLRISNN